jgi:hypothetical protein
MINLLSDNSKQKCVFKVKHLSLPEKNKKKKCSYVLLAAVPCEYKANHPTQHSDMLANGPLPPKPLQ